MTAPVSRPVVNKVKIRDIRDSAWRALETFKTRDSGILDWFFTNRPKLFTESQQPKVGSSDHCTILAKPVIAPTSRPVVNKVKIRDMQDSAWRALDRWITQRIALQT